MLSLTTVATCFRRLRDLVRRRALDVSMDAEMRYHIECETAERVRGGMTPAEARRTAMRDFGGVERHKESARDVRGVRWLDDASRDLSWATRVLRHHPAFAASVVLTFALGIGCTTSIYTLVHGILLRRLPYANPGQLVTLWQRNDARSTSKVVVTVADFEAWRRRATSFSSMAALMPDPLTVDGQPAERVHAADITPGLFAMLGVRPVLGRDFTASDEAAGAAVVILSDAYWRARFSADTSIVGRTVSLDGKPFTVIGVMPRRFEPPRFGWMGDQSLWLPFVPSEENRSWGHVLQIVAREKPGVTNRQAEDEMLRLSGSLARENPSDKGWSSMIVPLAGEIMEEVRRPLMLLFGAVGVLLLMAVVNVASLVSSFSRRRHDEIVARRILGATAPRLLRQELALSLILGVAGTAVGVALAWLGTRGLLALIPPSVPRLQGVTLDVPVMAFAIAVSIAATLGFGVGGTWRAIADSSSNAMVQLRSIRTTTRAGGDRIIGAEVAFGLVLTIVAALTVRSLANLRAIPLGFDESNLVAGRVSLPGGYATPASQQAFFDALIERVRAIGGVTGATLVRSRPFACCAPSTGIFDPVRPGPMESLPIADIRYADDEYFRTMRIPVRAGGVFDESDAGTGEPRAVVSRATARALWGDANPIGATIGIKLDRTFTARVIGVVDDVHLVDPRTPVRPTVYLSTRRYPSSEADIVMRGSADPRALLSSLRAAVASLGPSLPLANAMTFESAVSDTMAEDRFIVALLSAFAALALLLAGVGIYGVMAGEVSARRKEIGVRLALGAKPAGITRMVLTRTMRPVGVGAACGLILALTVTRFMSSLVFGVPTWDPMSFASVTVILLVVAAFAALIPAGRAARLSPVEAIRLD